MGNYPEAPNKLEPDKQNLDFSADDRALKVVPRLVPYSIATGLALIATAIYLYQTNAQMVTPTNLLMCVGLALVMWAFGSQAKVANPNAVLGGSAAIAAIFFGMLQYFHKPPAEQVSKQADIKGTITGSFSPETESVDLQAGEDRAYGRWDTKHKKHSFIFSQRDMQAITCYDVTITKTKPDGGEQVIQFDVDAKPLHAAIKESGSVRLYYRGDDPDLQYFLFQSANDKTKPFPGCGTGRLVPGEGEDSGPGAWLPPLVPSAHAADGDALALLKSLGSDDTDIRREAREGLAKLGIPAIRPILDALAAAREDYRIEIGTTNGLLRMLELRTAQRADLIAAMTDADAAAVTRLIGHPDKSMRRNATRLLIGLADPRTVPHLLRILEFHSYNQARYSAAEVLSDTFPALMQDATLAKQIVSEVGRIAPALAKPVRDALSEILVFGGADPQPASEGWVYTGVLENEKEPWRDTIFKFTGKPADRPAAGDVMEATDQVYIRKGPRVFDKEFGYVNQEAIGIVNVGMRFKVEELASSPSGYLWVRGSLVQ